MQNPTLDRLDYALIHGLHVHPRATFRQLADVLDVSDQTVARRYRRLRDDGTVRVLGRLNARRVGFTDWLLRLQCTPDAASAVAAALAERDDTSWIRLASGGTEVTCAVQLRSAEQRDALLLRKLPGTRQVTAVSALWVLHLFRGDSGGWAGMAGMAGVAGMTGALDEERAATLHAAIPPSCPSDEPLGLEAGDGPLLHALALDGRAGYAELAAATGRHESTVRRRVEQLTTAEALYFDIDVDTGHYGLHAQARLYMSVAPAALTSVGEALAEHPEVPFVAVTTGPHNLVASVVCRDAHALYEYLALRVGTLAGVDAVETVPILRTFKRAGTAPRRR